MYDGTCLVVVGRLALKPLDVKARLVLDLVPVLGNEGRCRARRSLAPGYVRTITTCTAGHRTNRPELGLQKCTFKPTPSDPHRAWHAPHFPTGPWFAPSPQTQPFNHHHHGITTTARVLGQAPIQVRTSAAMQQVMQLSMRFQKARDEARWNW